MSLARRLRDHARFRTRRRGLFAVEVALALAGLVLIGFGGTGWTDLAGAASSIVGVVLLWRSVTRARRAACNVRIVPNRTAGAALDAATLPPGWSRLPHGPRIVHDPATDAALDAGHNPLAWHPSAYAVPDTLDAYLDRCIDMEPPAFNEAKVRLRTDLSAALLRADAPVTVQPTDYFSGRVTNERALDQFELLDDERRALPGLAAAVVDYVVVDGRLATLSESRLSNHVGVSTLVIALGDAGDPQVVLQEQGRQAIDSYRTNVGGSGSADLADFRPRHRSDGPITLQQAVRRAMEREATQEIGLAIGPSMAWTTLTGHARFLDRGGKPEFFGITVSRMGLDRLVIPPAERDFVHRLWGEPFGGDAVGLVALIDRLLADAAQPSPSFVACLSLARAHVLRAGLDLSPPAA